MVANPDILRKCQPILKKEYFTREYQKAYEFINKFLLEMNRAPTRNIVWSETGVKLDPAEDYRDAEIADYMVTSIVDHCRHSQLIDFLNDSSEQINKLRQSQTAIDRGTLSSFMKTIETISNTSVQQNLGYEFHKDVETLIEMSKSHDGVATGLDFLDEVLEGGVTQPSVNVVSAASGHGKSVFLQNMAIYQLRRGKNVIYFSLELQPEMLAKRFAAMMTDTAMGKIYTEVDSVVYQVHRNGKKEGKLRIVKYNMSGTTVADLRNYHKEVSEHDGVLYDVVCADYMDLFWAMRPGIQADNVSAKDKAVSEEMNDFAHDKYCKKVIWTASQMTKGQDEEKATGQGRVAGGKSKVDAADNLFILKRTIEDKQEERIWLHISKARSSRAEGASIPLHWNPATLRIGNGDRSLLMEANPFLYGKVEKPKENVEGNVAAAENKTITTIRSRLAQNKEAKNG